MNIHLKIKIKTLAAEAHIIRQESAKKLKWARKAKEAATKVRAYGLYHGLNDHRRVQVRKEARASCLAYGFLRGVDYEVMETKCYSRPDWKRVEALIKRFGVEDDRIREQKFAEWKALAEERLCHD